MSAASSTGSPARARAPSRRRRSTRGREAGRLDSAARRRSRRPRARSRPAVGELIGARRGSGTRAGGRVSSGGCGPLGPADPGSRRGARLVHPDRASSPRRWCCRRRAPARRDHRGSRWETPRGTSPATCGRDHDAVNGRGPRSGPSSGSCSVDHPGHAAAGELAAVTPCAAQHRALAGAEARGRHVHRTGRYALFLLSTRSMSYPAAPGACPPGEVALNARRPAEQFVRATPRCDRRVRRGESWSARGIAADTRFAVGAHFQIV